MQLDRLMLGRMAKEMGFDESEENMWRSNLWNIVELPKNKRRLMLWIL